MAKAGKGLARGMARLLVAWLRKGRIPKALAYPVIGAAAWLTAAGEETWQYPPEWPMYCRAVIINRGPAVSNLRAIPNPSGGTRTVRVWATLVDSVGGMLAPEPEKIGVSGAILWTDSIPQGYKGGEKMFPADGAFDSDSEDVFLDLGITGLASGKHRVFVSGWDTEGMLGEPDSVDFKVK